MKNTIAMMMRISEDTEMKDMIYEKLTPLKKVLQQHDLVFKHTVLYVL